MTYLGAASKAAAAKSAARTAYGHPQSEYFDRQIAEAIAKLAEAVEELAKTMHRES